MSMIMYILILVLVLLAVRKSVAAVVDDNFTICSEATYCGGLNIKFPFYIQEPQCGYPGFNISCRNDTVPILTLPDGDDYIINHINYVNQSFQVAKADREAVCKQSITNISIPEDRLSLPKNQTQIFLLFACNLTSESSWGLSKYKVNCSGQTETSATMALLDDDPLLDSATKYCDKIVAAPVSFNEGVSGVEEMVNRGFELNWIASNCSICEGTGGKCGFDYSTFHFKCFCRDRPHAWHCTPAENSTGLTTKLATAFAAGVMVLIALAFCFRRRLSLIWKMKTEEDKKIEAFLESNHFLAPKRYKYSDIKNMTNSFQHKLGKGGFGDVYRGRLLDGRDVAVKILTKTERNGEDFMNEVASISRTSHINIVSLLGFCFQGRQRALIYEFVPNGSLEKFIFQEKESAHTRRLDWETLYNIAVGIARGLEYLHGDCNTRILHFDIKPHNILLDDAFRPKISDFGLAKLCPDKQSAISMTGARGTAGYIAPEVFSRHFGKVSHKSDVYSYGMMILEMVGGRRNINVEVDRTSEIYFPHWIHSRIELDEQLELQGIVNEDDEERARKMIIVSLWCIQTDPSNRPPMSSVVKMMEGSIGLLTIPPKPFLSSSSPKSPASNSSTTPLS